jgi:hypothetical protein
MIIDRGSIKWTSMMIPEHVKYLREWKFHELNDEEKPQLSDQQLEIMDEIMGYAMHHCLQVYICFYDHSIRKKVEYFGEVKKVDHLNRTIHFLSEDGFSKRIKFEDVLELSLR